MSYEEVDEIRRYYLLSEVNGCAQEDDYHAELFLPQVELLLIIVR